jgi:hypothetical protein
MVRNDTGLGVTGATVGIYDLNDFVDDLNEGLLSFDVTDSNGNFSIDWIVEDTGFQDGIVQIIAVFLGSSDFMTSFTDVYSINVDLPDTISPSITVFHSPNQPTNSDNIVFSIIAEDELQGSGLSEVMLYVDNILVETWSEIGSFTEISFVGGSYSLGEHSYYVLATDNAGNTNRDPISGKRVFSVNIEETRAVTILTLNPLPSEIRAGTTIIFNGRLTEMNNGLGISNVLVTIFDDDDSSQSDVLASNTTDTDGYFNIHWDAGCTDNENPCIIEIFARFDGTSNYESSSEPSIGYHVLQIIIPRAVFNGQVVCELEDGLCGEASVGTHLFNISQPSDRYAPIPWVKLELIWNGGSMITYADANGDYLFSNVPLYGASGKHEFRIQVSLTDNKLINILDCSVPTCNLPYRLGDLFTKETNSFTPPDETIIPLGPIIFSGQKETDAASFYIYFISVAKFYSEILDVDLEKEGPLDVNIFVPNIRSYYYPSYRYIALDDTYPRQHEKTWTDLIAHEFTHYVHILDGNTPGATWEWWWENFAQFMQEAIQSEFMDYGRVGTNACGPVEIDSKFPYRPANRDDPRSDEDALHCFTSPILLDFMDGDIDYDQGDDDDVDMPIKLLWDNLGRAAIQSLSDLYNILITLDINGDGFVDSTDRELVEAIFASHSAPGGKAQN